MFLRWFMDDANSQTEPRQARLVALRAKGIEPCQNKFTPSETCAVARAADTGGREAALAGRLTAPPDMGKATMMIASTLNWRTTTEHQAGGEQQNLAEDFLVALEYSSPPAGVIGIGIDRLGANIHTIFPSARSLQPGSARNNTNSKQDHKP